MNSPTLQRPNIQPPPTRLQRLARFAQRHHWAALATWIALLAGLTLASQVVGDDYSNGSDVSLSGTQSQQVSDLLRAHAPDQSGDAVTVVLHNEQGWDSELDTAGLLSDLANVAEVDDVIAPDAAQGSVSPDGTLALVQVAIAADTGGAPVTTYEALRDTATSYATGALQIELGGKGIEKLEQGQAGIAEGVGLAAALVILVFMFGSLLAASLPLITAILAVGTTLGLVVLGSHLIAVPDFTPPLLALVGLGVGIDYALIIFSRFRSEILRGSNRTASIDAALNTAGRSVLFAAASVVIAMSGMFVLGIPAFEGTVAAVALTVLVTMAASLTLLPALLSAFGARIERRVRRHAAKTQRMSGDRWRRWAGLVASRPWVPLVASFGALLVLSLPVLGIRLGLGDAGTDAPGSTTRAAYDLVSDKLGPGANGPLVVLAQGSSAEAEATRQKIAETPGVVAERVSPPMPLTDTLFLIRAEPTTGPQEEATANLVSQLRSDLGEHNLVGGLTAANIDFSQKLSERLPLFVGVVVAFSALLLLCVFRSVPIALKAAVFNLLSIGAALGAMKLVYQDGWLWGEPGPIEAFMPVFIFAIVFGLSMDYEVFLVSRIREVWTATGDASLAVREGLAHTGGVITAAAAIMFAVFGSVALLPDRMLAQAGFAMAIAVLLDAVVIRCLMVPAALSVLGARAWWGGRRS